jgi:hypothetical protein
LLLLITVTNAVSARGINSNKKHIFVIHSYNTDFDWTINHQRGIQEAFDKLLSSHGQWELHVFYLDGKRYQEQPQKIQPKITEIKRDVEKYSPEGVVITDDLAFSIFSSYFKDKNIPIAFSGINNNSLQKQGYKIDERGMTGTLETYNFPVVVRILKRLNPNVKSVIFVSDKSITSNGMVANTQQQIRDGRFDHLGINDYSFFSTQYFDKLKQKFLALNPNDTIVIILTNYALIDSHGEHVHHDLVDAWIAKNTKLYVAGTLVSQVKTGHLITLASFPDEMGFYCSSNLFNAIIAQEDPAKYGIRQFVPLRPQFGLGEFPRLQAITSVKIGSEQRI